MVTLPDGRFAAAGSRTIDNDSQGWLVITDGKFNKIEQYTFGNKGV